MMDTVNLLAEIEVLKRRLENAVEVVRCKECKWASPRSLPYETGYYCLFHRVWKGDNGYCDDGEREGE